MIYMSYQTLASSEMLKQLTSEINFPFCSNKRKTKKKNCAVI